MDIQNSRLGRVWWFLSQHTVPVEGQSHVVEMECPDHGHVVATEASVPEWTDGDLAAYGCARCRQVHVFRWGPRRPSASATSRSSDAGGRR